MTDRTGWRSLLEWALAFGLLALAVIAMASIGMFVVPFAVIAFVFAARRNGGISPEPESGALVGVGAVCLFVAYRNRGYARCPEGPIRLGPGEHFRCGGLNPIPWLTIGTLLVAAGIIYYLVVRRNRRLATT